MNVTDQLERIVAAIQGYRFRYTNEDQLQEALTVGLRDRGFLVRREVRLDAHNRIDLLVDRVGIEVKVAGTAAAVDRQLRRYAAHEDIDAILLVTSRSRHRVPAEIDGKPVRVLTLMAGGL